MKPEIKIGFSDFWDGFNCDDNYFTRLLENSFDVKVTSDPDFLIFSVHGNQFLKYKKAVRIFFTGENIKPNFSYCDYAIGFHHLNDRRYIRFPLFLLYGDVNQLLKPIDVDTVFKEKDSFCNFIVSNGNAKERIAFFHQLSEYKKVDSAGKVLNNIGKPLEYANNGKLKFIKNYKFTIAFENEASPGYTTEKIFEPMLMNSIPIYWGNPTIDKDFNPKSFVNVNEFTSFDEAIKYIIQLDQDEELFKQKLIQPWFNNNELPDTFRSDYLLRFLENAIKKGKTRKRNHYMYNVIHFHKQYLSENFQKKYNSLTRRIKRLSKNENLTN